jgi:hypothetical protein
MKDKHGDLNGFGKTAIVLIIVVFSLCVISLLMWVMPTYSVWSRGLRGQAQEEPLPAGTRKRHVKSYAN